MERHDHSTAKDIDERRMNRRDLLLGTSVTLGFAALAFCGIRTIDSHEEWRIEKESTPVPPESTPLPTIEATPAAAL